MSEHTKEPWEVWTSNSHIRISADGKDGSVVCATRAADGMPVLAIKEADARRIVACVNTCAGLGTAMLETRSLGDVYADFWNSHREAKQQHDALLAAAKDYATHYLLDEKDDSRLCFDEQHHKCIVALFDAITKAEDSH